MEGALTQPLGNQPVADSTQHKAPNMTDDTIVACLRAAGLASDRLLLPSSASFEARQDSLWSCTARALRPACIVQPRSEQEVAVVLRAVAEAGIPFAVRSGGHMSVVGANNIGSEGVTIDLGRLDWVRVVAPADAGDAPTVDIGPGNRWGRVYTVLEGQGLTVAGGREGNVGVAGLLLGGGLAFFTARHGLACDNVVECEVVLADGRVVLARDDGGDLLRALRGGGGTNFGIVTNFRMRTLPARPVWAGMTVHPKTAIPDAIAALERFADHIPDDLDANLLCFFTYMPEYKDIVVLGALIHVAGVAEAPVYKNWLELPTLATTCKMTTVPQLAMDYSQAQNYHNTWFTATFRNDARILAKAAELHSQLVQELQAFIPDGDFVTQCLFQPLPRVATERSASGHGNVLGLDRLSRCNGLLWLAVAQVRTPAQSRFAHARVRAWVQQVRAFAAAVDGDLGWTYLNYADSSQDPLASYGAENMRFMHEVAAKYDPGRVFRTLCPGGFKLQ